MDWLLIDGMNLAYRSFFAIRELRRSDGFSTNAIHGWIRTLWMLIDTHKPKKGVVVFFDAFGGSDRHLKILPEYKSQRADTPEDLLAQLPFIKQTVRFMGYALIEQPGMEADDLLASASVGLSQQGDEVGIVSADKDFAQLVGEKLFWIVPPPTANPALGWRCFDPGVVKSKFGVMPVQIPDYLAIIGDSSDNIPGIRGVGPKTALKWLQDYGNIAGMLEHIDSIEPTRFREKLAESKDLLARNLTLVRLKTDCILPDLTPFKTDSKALIALLELMEMNKTVAEVNKRMGQMELF
jgi:DNA polymerase I